MFYFEIILIAISLSIDAFSLAVSIGLNNVNKINYKKYSLAVGLFHFLMPIIGFSMKTIVKKIVYIPNKEIFIIVLMFLIIGILLDKNENKCIINPYLFALSVSIDSFVIGFSIVRKYLLYSIISFSIISFIFTYVGFKLSIKIRTRFKNNSKLISIFILIFILIYNLLN